MTKKGATGDSFSHFLFPSKNGQNFPTFSHFLFPSKNGQNVPTKQLATTTATRLTRKRSFF